MTTALEAPIADAAPERMLKAEQVAERLDCCLSIAKRLIRAGDIPSVKIGHLRRVRESDLTAYMRGLPVVPVQPREKSADAA